MAKTKKPQKGRINPSQGFDGDFGMKNRRRHQKRIKRVSWRDEQIEGMSVSDVPGDEFSDPAILVIRENVKICYSKNELIKLREAPLSKKKPDFVDTSECPSSIWDPEKWGYERKTSENSTENGPRPGAEGPPDHRRRPGDPRERIRKENDGIVLSPQRRSFNNGCHVPVRGDAFKGNRAHSPLGSKNENPHMGIREIQPSTRRIGSGRILRDSWDFGGDKHDSGDNEYSYRGQQRNNNNDREDKFGEKFERRSFGRDFDMTRDRENNNKESRRGNKGYGRRIADREIEEPEWFSGGPMSQNDTIELRGFDDDKPGKKKISPTGGKRVKESRKKSETNQQQPNPEPEAALPNSTGAPQDGDKNDAKNKKKTDDVAKDNKDTEKTEKVDEEGKIAGLGNDHSFNFDDILKCDTIPGLLSNGIGADGDATKSRFSRWFKQESPEKPDSRRSSLHEDHHLIKNLLKEIGETSVQIPGDSESYFAPISPAANTTGSVIGSKREFQQQSQPINIVEMLQRGKQENPEAMKQSLPGKILSLDELEAKIRHNMETSAGMNQKTQQKPDEDMAAAFKKLLEQAQTGGHPASINPSLSKSQPMSLLEMLNHSQQQDEAARLGANPHIIGPVTSAIGGHQHHQHVPNDLTMKLQQAQLQQQQQQMEMLNKLINATTSVHPQQLRASPLHDLVMQQSRDLLSRPEAQAILQAMHQRIPSPRELQVHTQGILQRALIKKKLEEQQENYRKKQEMQRGQSPSNIGSQVPAKSVSSPTPLAFTPTSVLRKMTAEKDEGKENKAIEGKVPPGRPLTAMRTQPPQPQVQQWNPNGQFMSGKHPGMSRPIVKANSNFQPEQFFGQQASQPQQSQQHPAQQQQRVQQQQMAFQQQRKVMGQQVMGPQFPSGQGVPQSQYNTQQYSTNQQFTQQQLRAQHQHRPSNQQQPSTQHQPQQMNFQQQQSNQPLAGGSWQFFSNTHQGSRSSKTGLDIDGSRLTSNTNPSKTAAVNLARWFSPDLLERARGGELPSTAGLSQHVLSLEELERQTAPPVHN